MELEVEIQNLEVFTFFITFLGFDGNLKILKIVFFFQKQC